MSGIPLWLLLSLPSLVQGSDPGPRSGGLAPGEGREVVETVCTACHTVDNIVASHMSRKSWDTTISWMQDTQGLGPLEPDVRDTILSYLEATQGLDASGGAVDAVDSPWAFPLYRPNPIW